MTGVTTVNAAADFHFLTVLQQRLQIRIVHLVQEIGAELLTFFIHRGIVVDDDVENLPAAGFNGNELLIGVRVKLEIFRNGISLCEWFHRFHRGGRGWSCGGRRLRFRRCGGFRRCGLRCSLRRFGFRGVGGVDNHIILGGIGFGGCRDGQKGHTQHQHRKQGEKAAIKSQWKHPPFPWFRRHWAQPGLLPAGRTGLPASGRTRAPCR